MVLSDEITIQPFDTKVRVLIADTIDEALTYWEENLTPSFNMDKTPYLNLNGMFLYKQDVDGINYYGLVLRGDCFEKTIVHEIFHLVMKIADDKGCSWSNESDEWYAYCLALVWEDVTSLMISYKVNKEEIEGI